MNLHLTNSTYLKSLKNSIQESESIYREEDSFPLDDTKISVSSIVTGACPVLQGSTHDTDAENSVIIYKWLNSLTPIQAADERIWAYLTHTVYFEYTQKRWLKETSSSILERFFIGAGGTKGTARNSIARLWWGAFMTDAGDENYDLTKLFFEFTNIQTAFMERNIGHSKKILLNLLRVIQKHREAFDAVGKKKEFIQTFAKKVNILGGSFFLDALPDERLFTLFEDRFQECL